jgi:SAM-dependent methyltransferase
VTPRARDPGTGSAPAPGVPDPRRAQVFGDAAELYDRARPAYPDEVLALVLRVDAARRVVEAGTGTGKATGFFAERGLGIFAVEPDPRMAAVARRNLARFPAVEVRVARFEDVVLEPAAYDVGLSAQAWHWVDPEAGARQMAAAIRPGGLLALVWNWPDTVEDPLRPAIQAAYEQHAPELAGADILTAPQVLREDHFAPLATAFEPPEVHEHSWVQRYTSTEYAELVQTHSPQRLLPEEQRTRLVAAVRQAIEDAGGEYEYPHRTTLLRFRRR